jgi:HSP20 family protein
MSQYAQVADRAERAQAPAAPQVAKEPARRVTVTPAVDIFEDAQAVTLLADLPGVSRDRLEIRVQDGSLTIDAQAVLPTSPELRVSYAESRALHFARRFVVSDDFDTSRIEANLNDGVLTIRIPRREASTPRRIEVNVG